MAQRTSELVQSMIKDYEAAKRRVILLPFCYSLPSFILFFYLFIIPLLS